jgi:hypothetical protein
MATEKSNEAETGTLGRLSKRGEEALGRLIDELGKNERVSDALGRAASAKGKLDDGAKRALGQAGVAAADELRDLRRHVERLEKRVAKLEGSKAKPGARTAASKATTRAKTTKKTESAPSPAPGRSVGGGSGRGSG